MMIWVLLLSACACEGASIPRTRDGVVTIVLGATPCVLGSCDASVSPPLPGGFNATWGYNQTQPKSCQFEVCSLPIQKFEACVNASMRDGETAMMLACGLNTLGAIGVVSRYPSLAIGLIGDGPTCTSVSQTECGFSGYAWRFAEAFRKAIVNGHLSCDDASVVNNLCAATIMF